MSQKFTEVEIERHPTFKLLEWACELLGVNLKKWEFESAEQFEDEIFKTDIIVIKYSSKELKGVVLCVSLQLDKENDAWELSEEDFFQITSAEMI